MNVHTRWEDPADDARCIAWAREFFNAAAPHAAGSVYINFLTEDESEPDCRGVRRKLRPAGADQAKYDPNNLFRSNQNIRPAP